MIMVYSMNSLTKYKRKKLKTRKCLNKLRKRLFSDSVKDISKDHKPAFMNDSEKYIKPKLNSITTSRLTLGFINKAVQSKTITRHALSTIQKKSGVSKNIFDKKKTVFDDHNSILQYSPTSDTSKPSLEVITASDSIKEFFYKTNLSNSPSLFSSLKSDLTKVSSFEESGSDLVENLHVTSSLKSLDKSQKMYEDFMECFSKYLTQNASELIEEKIIETPGVYLHNLDLQGHLNEAESNNARCLQNYRKSSVNNRTVELSSEIMIEENPISYIKLGYTRQQAASWEAASSIPRSRSNSLQPILDTSNVSCVSLHDTPEYIFYPHRLNH